VTETTIRGRYRYGLYKFIDWAIDKRLYPGPRPTFVCIALQNLAALPRDAFEDAELLDLLRLPLFTGCAGPHRIWTPGRYFVQNHLYWAYLILILTGMRPGEVGQIKCVDLQTDGEFYYFDLRPFDARKGRVAIEDLRNLKTNSSGRVVPIHPLLIELGLLDRLLYLMNANEERLFPEWSSHAATALRAGRSPSQKLAIRQEGPENCSDRSHSVCDAAFDGRLA
jgi:integrase